MNDEIDYIYEKEHNIKRKVKTVSNKYYDLLEISEKSSPKEIKKSYYKQSQKYHPDKHVNINKQKKKEFTEKFKQINNAYSVLSDPEKKFIYDKYGIDNSKKENISSDLFTEIFTGNNDILCFIGKLRIFSYFDLLKKCQKDFDLVELNQNKRELKIIDFLSKILDNPNMDNDIILSEKINKIMEDPIGELIINRIAFIYIESAHEYLEKKKLKYFLKKKKILLERVLRLLKSGTFFLITEKKKKSLRAGSLIWSIITMDIDITIRSSCFKLFTDTSVNETTKINRAKNLLKIGNQIYNENINYQKKCLVIGKKIDEVVVFN